MPYQQRGVTGGISQSPHFVPWDSWNLFDIHGPCKYRMTILAFDNVEPSFWFTHSLPARIMSSPPHTQFTEQQLLQDFLVNAEHDKTRSQITREQSATYEIGN